MRLLSLFSGIGGLDLGLERAGFQVVAQVERDPFARAVLAKHWPGVPCFDDVTTFDPVPFAPVDVVCGGFPCQDVSVAGKGVGVEKGERSGLWREMARVIDLVRPRWVIAENVPALRTRGADLVLGDLERLGYACWPLVVGAEHVGAPHRRHRVFIVGRLAHDAGQERGRSGWDDTNGAEAVGSEAAHLDQRRGEAELAHATSGGFGADRRARSDGGHADECGTLEHATIAGLEGRRQGLPSEGCDAMGDADVSTRAAEHLPGCAGREAPQLARSMRWPSGPGQPQNEWEAPRLVELPLGCQPDGVPARLVRFANRNALRSYGNAVVPQVAEVVGRAVRDAEREMREECAA